MSAGNSGPNSVDQAPGSVYSSDQVTTPQGLTTNMMSPQQPLQQYVPTNTTNQLHSPAPVSNVAAPPAMVVGGAQYLPPSHPSDVLTYGGGMSSQSYHQQGELSSLSTELSKLIM